MLLFKVYYHLQDLVLLLLQFNASVGITNGEGRKPYDLTKPDSDIYKLLIAALAADIRRKEERLLSASRENDLATISLLVIQVPLGFKT